MKHHPKIASQLFGFFFSLAILFPSVFQFAHAFETHEHKACDEITIHIHEKEVECDLHDFQLTPSHFHLETYPEFLEETLISTEINWATPSFISVEKHHFFLRGPPVIQLCS